MTCFYILTILIISASFGVNHNSWYTWNISFYFAFVSVVSIFYLFCYILNFMLLLYYSLHFSSTWFLCFIKTHTHTYTYIYLSGIVSERKQEWEWGVSHSLTPDDFNSQAEPGCNWKFHPLLPRGCQELKCWDLIHCFPCDSAGAGAETTARTQTGALIPVT